MFSYYGSKSKVIDHYPPPKYDKIIEPFAGSARYALKYFEKDVLLVDKYEVIVNLWKWLQVASKQDILKLPNVAKGEDIRKLNLSAEEKYLIGYCIGRGNSYPVNVPGNYNSWEKDKVRIASNLFKIRHWKIIEEDYNNLKDELATWFIDPPYIVGGHKYKHNSIDYESLASWCKSRNGQIIVCENTKADWLPFKPMVKMTGAQTKTTEAIWSNLPTSFDNTQTKLF